MLRKLLIDEIKWRGLSVRAAAQEIGVAHTTVLRLIEGKPGDLETMRKVCSWLNVEMATILSSHERSEKALAEKFAIIMERNPGLYQMFEGYYEKTETKEIDLRDLEEILAFLIFRTYYRKLDFAD